VSGPKYLRIGEVAQRTGVEPALLRAWERRYRVLLPRRSEGGFRLYGDEDVERVKRMQQLIAGGVSAAEAARLVDVDAALPAGTPLDPAELLEALERLDDVGANAILDRYLAGLSTETVVRDAIVPVLRALGDGWERGDVTVGQEHFASTVLRGRLLALARGWDQGGGPSVVLACAPGEQHDLPLVMLGLALRARGWRVTFLGADTPLESVADAARRVHADAAVVAAVMPGLLDRLSSTLKGIARQRRLVLAGPGTTPALARRVGAGFLDGDPIAAADGLARLVQA
jgi:DNA-binding transcriptional MerR regulator